MNHRICRTAVMRVGTLSLVVVTELVLWSLLLSPVCCMLAQLVVAVVHSTYDTMIVEEGGVLYHSGWVRLCLAEIMMTTAEIIMMTTEASEQSSACVVVWLNRSEAAHSEEISTTLTERYFISAAGSICKGKINNSAHSKVRWSACNCSDIAEVSAACHR